LTRGGLDECELGGAVIDGRYVVDAERGEVDLVAARLKIEDQVGGSGGAV
jgi:hypothetical protein